jgi:hypothetical protein
MRIREWAGRYVPAECAAIVGVLMGSLAVGPLGIPAATAYGATIGEAVFFYGFVVIRDRRRRPDHSIVVTCRDLAVEFGPSEVVDTVAARPLAMYLGQLVIGDLAVGVLLGKVAADMIFYGLAIIGYERRKSREARQAEAAAVPAAVTAGSSEEHPTPRPAAPRTAARPPRAPARSRRSGWSSARREPASRSRQPRRTPGNG